MQEPSQQEPKPKSPAGYRPLVPADLAVSMGNAHYGYVAAAAVLGVVMGVAIALTAGHAKSAAPGVSAALSAHTSGLSMLPAAYTGPAPSLLSPVDNQRTAGAGSAVLTTVSDKPASEPAKAHKRHGLHKLLDWRKASRDRRTIKRMPYVSPNPPAAPDEPTALQLATTAAAAGPFFLDIQGDLTVANFDAASGTIETYEGETYTLASAASGGSSIPWQDYPFNVHYRCDEAGNCTLFHGGASATAKLTR
jgi:hypothetical protein